MDTINCVVPFRFGRRYGDSWTCPDCGRTWTIESNLYDSLLPFGDYTWWTERERDGLYGKIFGPTVHRALRFQPEPSEVDRDRLARLLHIFDSLGLPHTAALAIYDLNAAAGLPYHGAAHGISVALRAIDFARAEGLDGIREIALAALFHDADYVPGDPEARNLARAVAFALEHAPAALAASVAALIPETEYPHQAPSTRAGAVLQDADVLQARDVDSKRWAIAFATESGREGDPGFPPVEILHTEAGREYRARNH